MSTSPFRTEKARQAALTRSRLADDPELVASRQLMQEHRLIEIIERALKLSPPLTAELRARIDAMITDQQVVA